MLYKVGLLPPGNFQQVPFAYKMYMRVDKYGWDQSHEFKSAFSTDVSIEFIGVWYVSSFSNKAKKRKITRIAGILFRLLVLFVEDRCQSLQLVPTREHSDMRYLLMNDEPGSKHTFGKRNKSIISIVMMRQIMTQKPM